MMKPHHVWRRGEMHKGFWWGNLRKRDHLENPGVDGRIILKWILKKYAGRAWTGLNWLMLETSGRLW
jgi:hypothetical protein